MSILYFIGLNDSTRRIPGRDRIPQLHSPHFVFFSTPFDRARRADSNDIIVIIVSDVLRLVIGW